MTDATRSAFLALSFVIAAALRGGKKAAGLRACVDAAWGTAPRAADKRRARASALRELASAETSGALAELEAAYAGGAA